MHGVLGLFLSLGFEVLNAYADLCGPAYRTATLSSCTFSIIQVKALALDTACVTPLNHIVELTQNEMGLKRAQIISAIDCLIPEWHIFQSHNVLLNYNV